MVKDGRSNVAPAGTAQIDGALVAASAEQGGGRAGALDAVRAMMLGELESLATTRSSADGLRLRVLMRMADRLVADG